MPLLQTGVPHGTASAIHSPDYIRLTTHTIKTITNIVPSIPYPSIAVSFRSRCFQCGAPCDAVFSSFIYILDDWATAVQFRTGSDATRPFLSLHAGGRSENQQRLRNLRALR